MRQENNCHNCGSNDYFSGYEGIIKCKICWESYQPINFDLIHFAFIHIGRKK